MLIDQALDMCVHTVPPWHGRSWDEYGGRPRRAGILGWQAQMINHPDMESVCSRVLASRRATREDAWKAVDENLMLVTLLASVNPDLARDVLDVMESRIKRTTGRVPWLHWTMAWSLVDPEQFPERVRRRLSQVEDAKGRYLALQDILKVANVMTAAPVDRPRIALRNHGGLWWPCKDL